jgi:hypothetical protein
MKKHLKYFSYALIALFFASSCSKDEFESNFSTDNDFIKSEISNNTIVTNYKYNNNGKIAEAEGIYSYSRYLYDSEDKLIKIETAADESIFSSSLPVEKTELMTAQNSAINSYRILKYDENGELLEMENYFKMEDKFELKSMQSFEFVNEKIAKRNLHNENGEITQFNVYEYDINGNVKNEKYYSFLFTESAEPKLISEISFEFDDKKNPFKIFSELGNPGLYTNPNSIIETITIRHEDIPGFDRMSASSTSYEYNQNNYPIKVITGNSEYKYKY